MTRRPIQWDVALFWIGAAVFLAVFWGSVIAAFAQDTYSWNPETRVTLQPSHMQGARAEVVFLNTAIHLEPSYSFALTLDGLTVDVAVTINDFGADDLITVTPPEGFIAWPSELLVPEDGAGVIYILEDAQS